jgi:hypothetical protein
MYNPSESLGCLRTKQSQKKLVISAALVVISWSIDEARGEAAFSFTVYLPLQSVIQYNLYRTVHRELWTDNTVSILELRHSHTQTLSQVEVTYIGVT